MRLLSGWTDQARRQGRPVIEHTVVLDPFADAHLGIIAGTTGLDRADALTLAVEATSAAVALMQVARKQYSWRFSGPADDSALVDRYWAAFNAAKRGAGARMTLAVSDEVDAFLRDRMRETGWDLNQTASKSVIFLSNFLERSICRGEVFVIPASTKTPEYVCTARDVFGFDAISGPGDTGLST
jgi:hypothetical protein